MTRLNAIVKTALTGQGIAPESAQILAAAYETDVAALTARLAEQREQHAQIVEKLNLDYLSRDGLDGQRGFSVEAAAAIRGSSGDRS